jgi:hypothetical protein
MSDPVLIAIITGFTAVIVSISAGLQEASRRSTKRIRHQVENDHSTNMRVEQDERYEAQLKHNEEVMNALSAMRKQINRNTARTNQLWSKYVNRQR